MGSEDVYKRQDLVSLNLANRLTIDPENIDTIENLKKLLGG